MKKLLSISLILSILVCILPVASFATTDDALLHYDIPLLLSTSRQVAVQLPAP